MVDDPKESRPTDLMAGYTGNAGGTAKPHRTKTQAPSNRLKKFFLAWALFGGGTIAAAVGLRTLSEAPVSGVEREAVEACRWSLISTGRDDASYDWDRGYLRNVRNNLNMPQSTRLDGEPIKCVLAPKFGAEVSFQNCGLYTSWPDDHFVCWMIYDPAQEIWLHTWEAR